MFFRRTFSDFDFLIIHSEKFGSIMFFRRAFFWFWFLIIHSEKATHHLIPSTTLTHLIPSDTPHHTHIREREGGEADGWLLAILAQFQIEVEMFVISVVTVVTAKCCSRKRFLKQQHAHHASNQHHQATCNGCMSSIRGTSSNPGYSSIWGTSSIRGNSRNRGSSSIRGNSYSGLL